MFLCTGRFRISIKGVLKQRERIISPYEWIISPYRNYFELFHPMHQNSIISPYENHFELFHPIVKTVLFHPMRGLFHPMRIILNYFTA